jgi:hypothetical protein
MTEKKYRIGSKVFAVEFDDTPLSLLLQEEMDLYPEADGFADIEIQFRRGTRKVLALNPNSHEENPDGFTVYAKRYSVQWRAHDSLPKVYFDFFGSPKDYMFKFLLSMQFTHPYEQIGQTFHEEVIIPAFIYFFPDDISLVHGSAVESPDGGALVFGGTGGVGKTTIELELVLNHGYKFIADDMVLLDRDGSVFPNYAYPKIYAYNTAGEKKVSKKLLHNRPLVDRAWWQLQRKVSLKKTRRRAPLGDFYSGRISQGAGLRHMFLLLRTNRANLICHRAKGDLIAAMNDDVIQAEFSRHFDHLYWHNFNRRFLGGRVFELQQVRDLWRDNQRRALQEAECWIVEIPIGHTVRELKELIPRIIMDPGKFSS